MLRNATARSGARKHISASSLDALGCTYCVSENENAELVCNHQWTKGQCRALSFLWDLVSEIEIPVFTGAPSFSRYLEVPRIRRWKGMTAQLTPAQP